MTGHSELIRMTENRANRKLFRYPKFCQICDWNTSPIQSGAPLLMTEPSSKPRIAIGSDHAGFPVKEAIRKYLEGAGYAVDDQGTSSEDSVDYPDFGKAVGERVAAKQDDLGIAVCGSGIGISIAANKVPGIRAALAHNVLTAQLAREHNDANVLALGARIVTPAAALEMVHTFLTTPYAGGRHQRRLDKITQIENERGGTQ
jgi:ribose 5-phosphate isomerase B